MDPTGDWGDVHGDTCECDERDCRAVYDRYSDDFCSGKCLLIPTFKYRAFISLLSGWIPILTEAVKELQVHSKGFSIYGAPDSDLQTFWGIHTLGKDVRSKCPRSLQSSRIPYQGDP